MINNMIQTFRELPKKRCIQIIILSLIFMLLTMFITEDLLKYRFTYSLTFNRVNEELRNILGYGRFDVFLSILKMIKVLFWSGVFFLYLHLYCKREKRKMERHKLKRMMNEIKRFANGDFQTPLQTDHHNNLDELASGVNEIVQKLKQSIEEERHVEMMKNELVTNVSHDLRTPLTSILGYLRLIEEDKYKDEVVLRHYTGIAYSKARRMEKLLQELFEYTRLQDHQFSLRNDRINVEEMLSELMIQNEYHFTENQLLCREYFHVNQPFIIGDGERLARVFENLLMNAIQYGKDGEYIDIELLELDEDIQVTISNYGKPISQVDLPYVFERFYRVEKSRATHTGGTGLGLSIAKSIVSRHKGTIEVVSGQTKTSFIVILPKSKRGWDITNLK